VERGEVETGGNTPGPLATAARAKLLWGRTLELTLGRRRQEQRRSNRHREVASATARWRRRRRCEQDKSVIRELGRKLEDITGHGGSNDARLVHATALIVEASRAQFGHRSDQLAADHAGDAHDGDQSHDAV